MFEKRVAAFTVVAIATVLAGCGGDDNAASTTTAAAQKPAPADASSTSVTLKEFTLTPDPTTVSAGKVTFNVQNAGQLKHEFVVLKTATPAADLLKGDEADESGNVGEIGNVPPGASKTLSLMLKPGHYALICNLPGHYKAGQHADLTVK